MTLFLRSKKLLKTFFFQKDASKVGKNLYKIFYNESDSKMVKNLYTAKIEYFSKKVLELL